MDRQAEDTPRRKEIIGALIAICSGAVAITGAVTGSGVAAWIGGAGFIVTMVWLILTANGADSRRGDVGTFQFGADGGCGGGGDGGGC